MVDLAIGAAGGIGSNVAGNAAYDGLGLGPTAKNKDVLDDILQCLKDIRDFMAPPETIIELEMLADGTGANIINSVDFTPRQRFYVQYINFACNVSGEFSLKIGAVNHHMVLGTSHQTYQLDWPIAIQAGQTISIQPWRGLALPASPNIVTVNLFGNYERGQG